MRRHLTPFAVFVTASLTPALAFACALYRVASTTPLDYVVYGAFAGSIGVARLWDRGVRDRDLQLKKFGIWVLLSFAMGIAFAREYSIEMSFFTVNGLLASSFVLSGILFRGWASVRKLFILLGFVVALPGACGFSCTAVGPDPHHVPPKSMAAQNVEF